MCFVLFFLFFLPLKLEAEQLEEGVFHRELRELLKITLTHHILWIGSFYIQLLDPVYLISQFLKQQLKQTKKEHLNTQNLLLKPLSAIEITGLYWI